MSPSALTVVHDLQNAGYAAEVVGGCVRDLLLGYVPKDFDVVTDAEPDEVRTIFRRARVIGRRFRLVHVRVGRDVVEVSTYRAAPKRGSAGFEAHAEQGRILRDNVFGTRDDDARRRDFSINALYYDPVENVVIDYVDGFSDLQRHLLRVIGDPIRRFEEDPVRMLRAVRFAVRLNLRMERRIESVLPDLAGLLVHVPPARLFDEVLKIFHGGHGYAAYEQLQRFGLLAELFPESVRAHTKVDLDPDHGLVSLALRNTDHRLAGGQPVIPAFLFAVMLWRAVCLEADRNQQRDMAPVQSLHRAIGTVIGRQQQRVTISRRVATTMFDMWNLQHWLLERRPRLVPKTLAHKRFRAAYDFLMLRISAGEATVEVGTWWTRIQEVDGPTRRKMITELTVPQKRGRPRHRRRKTA